MYAIKLRNGLVVRGYTLAEAVQKYVDHGVVVAVVRVEDDKVVVPKE
jgi:hypothetical protein